MEIRIKDVFNNSDDIRPTGKTIEDQNGNHKHCPNCIDGILFLEFESGHIKCTKCKYIE